MITFSRLGKFGRLGNQLFQIASTVGIARKNGVEYGFPRWEHEDRFRSLPRMGRPGRPIVVGWGYHDLRLTDGDLRGYLQSERYWADHEREVRDLFRFRRRGEPLDGCAIHIRRGDYDGDYHAILGPEYYLPAMERAGASRYTVFTDSPEQVEWISRYAEIRPVGHPVDDLQDFSLHQSYIIGNSSWSWWGSYLGQGQTIAPKTWFGWKYRALGMSDLIRKDWILL